MKKFIFTLALASSLTFTCTDTRAPIPIQDKVLVEGKESIDKSKLKKREQTYADTLTWDSIHKTHEYWLEEEMKSGNYVGAGDLILTILERRVNERYSIAKLHNLFLEIIKKLEKDKKIRERDFLMEEYNKYLQTI